MTTTTTERVAITGNTYPVRAALAMLGGVWDAAARAWMVPADKAEEARRFVAAAPQPVGRFLRSRKFHGRGWTRMMRVERQEPAAPVDDMEAQILRDELAANGL